tara:strand:- start:202 stop:555 length:354 start_codon:yes stop_codon:yes gene_type:complete
MKPSEAYDIMENPDDHSAAQVKKAKEVLRKYSEVTERDRTTGVSVSIMMPTPKPKRQAKGKPKSKKAEMMMGGMANGKKHMYSAGGDVTDNLPNPGLKALAKTAKGKSAVRKMGFDV